MAEPDDDAECGESEPRVPTARLFVGVRPPETLMAVLSAFPRPPLEAVRWTTSDQWHVTLAFLGDVAVSRIGKVGSALVSATARTSPPVEARLGPVTGRVGRSVLCVPVAGLDGLAGEVREALGSVVPGASLDEPFHGHLTLARGRGRRTVPSSLAGAALEASWEVREAGLVRSELGPSGAQYTTLMTATVGS